MGYNAAMTAAKDLFGDSGLMLAVLDGLMHTGALDETTIEAQLHGIADKNYDLDPDEQTIDIEHKRAQEAIAKLGELDLAPSDVNDVEKLDFDGGNDIYMALEGAIDIDTGGEEDWYELHSLAGIERLGALRRLSLDGHGYREAALDLTPLRGHPSLTELVLTGRCTNGAVLATLPELKSLDVSMAKLDVADLPDQLVARGINVKR
jgi:hypothetical protein